MRPLILRKSDGGWLEIGVAALKKMLAHRQDAPHKPEAGGVLLGRLILGSSDICVDEVTLPMRGDRRERHAFFRSRSPHQQVAVRIWRESEGTRTYLGEWHTHPESYPTPSGIDRLEWRRKLMERRHIGMTLYFAIVGLKAIRVWEGSQNTGSCKLLGEYLIPGERHVGK